ncbi:YqfQ family protein [Bacillus pinisoli]|uniref:YqfQ family protein n=1 Tax=Bacillus pinisoli TaxID=2901866 RepID=UPI001FF5F90E|nr:YqfQ family protein [Bacillus pinisoli]
MFPGGPRMPLGPMSRMNNFSSFMPMGRGVQMGQMPARGVGGILSRLFSRQGAGAAGAFNSFSGQSVGQGTGGLLSNLMANPGEMLANVQKAVNVANQVGPMVQQYGPMVRNIPALIKLYKEFNSSDDDSSEDVVEEKEVPIAKRVKTKNKSKKVAASNQSKNTNEEKKEPTTNQLKSKTEEKVIKKGVSKPKMYI